MMTDKNLDRKERFTPQEREQIRALFRYLIIVLLFVIAASLIMAVVVPAVTAQ